MKRILRNKLYEAQESIEWLDGMTDEDIEGLLDIDKEEAKEFLEKVNVIKKDLEDVVCIVEKSCGA